MARTPGAGAGSVPEGAPGCAGGGAEASAAKAAPSTSREFAPRIMRLCQHETRALGTSRAVGAVGRCAGDRQLGRPGAGLADRPRGERVLARRPRGPAARAVGLARAARWM